MYIPCKEKTSIPIDYRGHMLIRKFISEFLSHQYSQITNKLKNLPNNVCIDNGIT